MLKKIFPIIMVAIILLAAVGIFTFYESRFPGRVVGTIEGEDIVLSDTITQHIHFDNVSATTSDGPRLQAYIEAEWRYSKEGCDYASAPRFSLSDSRGEAFSRVDAKPTGFKRKTDCALAYDGHNDFIFKVTPDMIFSIQAEQEGCDIIVDYDVTIIECDPRDAS